MGNQSLEMIVQFQGIEAPLEITDEERIDFEYIKSMLENAPPNSMERIHMKNIEQLISFLNDIIQIKEDQVSLTKGANALNIIGPCDVKWKPSKLEIYTCLDKLYIKFQCASFLKLFKYRPTFSLTFSMFSAEIITEFKIDPKAGKIEYMHDFKIEKFEEGHYAVKGIWPFNKFATYALNFAAVHYKTSVRGWLEAQIRQQMNETVRALETKTPEATLLRMGQGNISLSEDECSRIDELLRNTEETRVKFRDTRPLCKKNEKGVRKVYAQQCILSPTFTRKADA
ncbi:uncharacterized protein TNCV_1996891 [Trichonephila clavipes]|uniref:Uncharacterized protein n=1 Tax=Trichonephila clavipes TaxID=2585209 RepID=A0A8X6RXV9_TRICX|nr:uncharacterized protein TNCV_1996891 [Trichonephila clavipes]